jgi:hypothetical protein
MAQGGIDERGGERRAHFFVRIAGGRIVEVHVRRLSNVQDVAMLEAQVKAAVAIVGPHGVFCGDHRYTAPLSSEVADAWSRAMSGNRRSAMRGGILLDPANALYNLQVERVVRCAPNPARFLFTDVEGLRAWVGATLTEPERHSLHNVLAAW